MRQFHSTATRLSPLALVSAATLLAGCVVTDRGAASDGAPLTREQSRSQIEARVRGRTEVFPEARVVKIEMNAYRTLACGLVALEGHEPHVFQSFDFEPDDDERGVAMAILSTGLWDDPRNRKLSALYLKSCQGRGLLTEVEASPGADQP